MDAVTSHAQGKTTIATTPDKQELEKLKQAMLDSSEWNGLLHYHRKLRGYWNDPNTGLTHRPPYNE